MSLIQLSVEEHSRGLLVNDNEIQTLLGSKWILPMECNPSSVSTVSDPYDLFLIDPQDSGIGKDEFDMYLIATDSSKGTTIDDSDYLALNNDILTLLEKSDHKVVQVASKRNHVLLSQSVGVTMPKAPINQSHRIQIVDGLESNYKPRYKSDYFAHDGTVRMPRYVANQNGNHFVKLKMLSDIQGSIQVDWVTIPTETGIRYSMPYKFQVDNKLSNVPDSNPINKIIDVDHAGIMKLYLVLIKAKQDALKLLQPLQPFPPSRHILEASDKNNLTETSPLTAKKLIEKYQLDKSQLAFTFCALGSDGTAGIPDWSTTVYSTVLTETSADISKKRKVTCPGCLHSFEITMDIANDISHGKVIKKRK